MSRNLLSKKVIIVAIIAAGAVSAILVASSIAQATAQHLQQKMMWSGEGMPKINGSVNVANETSNFISENVKVSFVTAAQNAQGQVAGTYRDPSQPLRRRGFLWSKGTFRALTRMALATGRA